MPKKPGKSSTPTLKKKTLKNLTSKNLRDDVQSKVAGGRMARDGYSCGINCSTSKDPT